MLVLLLMLFLPCTSPAQARPEISYLCVEADTGFVIAESNAGVQRPPASMVKLMLMLLVTEGLDTGVWQPETPITVSALAAAMGGSQVFLEAGEVWTLDHLMHAVSIASGNDAALAVAEGLYGSVEAYLAIANKRALELGMVDTVYNSAHGLPPSEGRDHDLTTARDMAILAREAVKHPRIFAWAGVREFQFKPGRAKQYNTNKLLWRMEECDGLKTGFTNAAGFCLTATAARNGLRVVTVVMGAPTVNERFRIAQELMEHALSTMKRATLLRAGDPVGSPMQVPFALGGAAEFAAAAPLSLLATAEDIPRIELALVLHESLLPPLAPNTVVGEVWAELDGRRLARAPVMVAERVELDMWALLTQASQADGHQEVAALSAEARSPSIASR
jgi:D-alanyl-D-alanine carboxypeptidase (penicillin-binding protein 5/6)